MVLPPVRSAVEDATPADADILAGIHERSFARPWSAEEILRLLADHPTVQGIVVRHGALKRSPIAGFAILRSAGGEAEILTLAIDPLSRRRGLGRLLIEEASRRAYRDRAEALFLEVDESNQAAVKLYRRLGFETVGRRSRYYEKPGGTPGTALVMRLRLR